MRAVPAERDADSRGAHAHQLRVGHSFATDGLVCCIKAHRETPGNRVLSLGVGLEQRGAHEVAGHGPPDVTAHAVRENGEQ